VSSEQVEHTSSSAQIEASSHKVGMHADVQISESRKIHIRFSVNQVDIQI
jgi:hypothetical protein